MRKHVANARISASGLRIVVSAVGLLLVAGYAAGESAALPETKPAQRLVEILDRLETGHRDSLVSYATTTFTPEMLLPDVDSIVDFLVGHHQAAGGFAVRRVIQSTPEQITVILQGRNDPDEWVKFVVGTETEPPHRVRGLFSYRVSPVLGAEESEPISPADLPGRLETLVGRLAKEDDFAGSVCLAQNGEILLSRAWGLANRESQTPNGTSTRFNVASLGKMFTAVAVLQLVESGALRLDDAVSKYVPDWLGPGTKEITVEQLLTHRSGLGDYLEPAMEDRSRVYSRLEDYRRLAAGETPLFPPGEGIQYSNTGFLLLGAVIQAVSRRPWHRYVEEEVFNRAGMTASRAYRPQIGDGSVATGYYQEGKDGEWLPNTDLLVGWGTSAGGNAATAEDLVAFAHALQEGRLLSKESLHEMTTPRNEIPGTGRYSGYGVMISGGKPGMRFYGHEGGFPGVSSLLEIDEKHGYVLAVLANQRAANQVREAWRELLRRSQMNAESKDSR